VPAVAEYNYRSILARNVQLPHNATMILIFPPVAKPCEPPAGIARLAGFLQARGIPCQLLDGNLEGLLWLLEQSCTATDTWSRRAATGMDRQLTALRNPATYCSPDRYSRAVKDLQRLLAMNSLGSGAQVSFGDYQQQRFSPQSSADLLQAAAAPELNPFYPWFSTRLPEAVAGEQIIGFSLNYLSQALCTFAMIGFLRRHYPKKTIVLGGGLVTSWSRRPDWHNPFSGLIDHLVSGPGEQPLLELLCGTDHAKTPALPDYSQLALSRYLAPGVILPYSAASGCYWNRCFCPERAEGNRYLPLPVPQVLAELATLCTLHKPALLHLLDNAVTPALLRGLTDSPPGAPWYGFSRFVPELDDVEFCRALRRSGCVMLKLGLESGSQQVLDTLEKGINLDMASRILNNLRQAGIGTYIYLLFGTPAEDESTARQTLDFVARHHQAIGFLNLALFNMPASGEEAASYGDQQFYAGDLSLYIDFSHPAGWDRQKVRRFISREFSRQPAIAAILRRDPPQFTSNHAPFFA